MDRLPPEVLTQIICQILPKSRLGVEATQLKKPWGNELSIAAFATVSKHWQPHIERLTFAKLHLSTTRLGAAREILTPPRFRYVRSIELEVELDTYDDEARTRVENADEKHGNNLVFTRTVAAFFLLLKPLNQGTRDRDTGDSGKLLRLTASSPSDPWRHHSQLQMVRKKRMNYQTDDILEARFNSSYLELLQKPDDTIGIFTKFEVPDPEARHLQHRRISPSACCQLASRLRNLTTIDWHLSDNEKNDNALRSRLRNDFARTIVAMPPSLQKMSLRYKHSAPLNQAMAPPSIAVDEGSDSGTDALSIALRRVVQRLVSAEITASLEPDFLWPPAAELEEEGPKWPRLQSLKLYLSPVSPGGKWLLDRHLHYRPSTRNSDSDSVSDDGIEDGLPDTPADQDRKEDAFRGSPNVPIMTSWLLAAGKSAAGMPSLQTLAVWTGCGTTLPPPYVSSCSLRYSVASKSLTVESTPVLKLDGDVAESWRAVAQAQAQMRGNGETLAIESKDAVFHQPPRKAQFAGFFGAQAPHQNIGPQTTGSSGAPVPAPINGSFGS